MSTLCGAIGSWTVEIRVSGDVRGNPDAALAALLPTAMLRGEPLTIDGTVSGKLLDSITTVQDIFAVWNSRYERVIVRADRALPLEPAAGVASFFSGGVDSFYTALRNADRITHLVLIHGFDVPLSAGDLRSEVSAAINQAADALGKPLIEIVTDLRDVIKPDWVWHHGAALAAIGHLLSHVVGTVLIPATHTYADLFPWGSHPLLDPLWSSERVSFVHHGAEASRFEKVKAISENAVALQHLRVCWENPNAAYNCGLCEKCTRTMIALHICGKLARCHTLPNALDLKRVQRLVLASSNDVAFAWENVVAADAAGHTDIASALRRAIYRYEARKVPRGRRSRFPRISAGSNSTERT